MEGKSVTKKTYVVTGSDGFIGRRLVELLIPQRNVICSPDLPHTRSLFYEHNADRYFRQPDDPYPEKIDGVFHLGAISDTRCKDMRALMKHNVNCTDQIFQWCAYNRVPLIYASSAATYGSKPCDDDIEPNRLRPLNDYGWSKNETDLRVTRLADHAIAPPRWVGLKLFNVYGHGEASKGDQASFIFKALFSKLRGNTVEVFDGTAEGASRDWIYVDDAVEAMIHLMELPYNGSSISGICNLGTGLSSTFSQVLDACKIGQAKIVPFPSVFFRNAYQWRTQASEEGMRRRGIDPSKFRSLKDGVEAIWKRMRFTP
jgi:ADP-L-glycero-D-manno-heptose 6-epimerase